MSKSLNFISLFSGCGGFDIGFIKSGFNCIGAYDNDSNAIYNYQKNIGDWINNCDLEKITGKELIKSNKKVDMVISGSPCQGYSTIGKRKLDDSRNNLLVKGGEIAINLNTNFFIAENVVGSLFGEHSMYWSILQKLFHKNGYRTKMEVLDSQYLG
jgi:DNA (cytosine-5)-methyltransferase 1